jgi:hypothetical protein
MLCGYPPFNGKNEKEIMDKITMQPLDFNSKFLIYFSSSVEQKKHEGQTAHYENVSKATRR